MEKAMSELAKKKASYDDIFPYPPAFRAGGAETANIGCKLALIKGYARIDHPPRVIGGLLVNKH